MNRLLGFIIYTQFFLQLTHFYSENSFRILLSLCSAFSSILYGNEFGHRLILCCSYLQLHACKERPFLVRLSLAVAVSGNQTPRNNVSNPWMRNGVSLWFFKNHCLNFLRFNHQTESSAVSSICVLISCSSFPPLVIRAQHHQQIGDSSALHVGSFLSWCCLAELRHSCRWLLSSSLTRRVGKRLSKHRLQSGGKSNNC